jgi:hypothetical protein
MFYDILKIGGVFDQWRYENFIFKAGDCRPSATPFFREGGLGTVAGDCRPSATPFFREGGLGTVAGDLLERIAFICAITSIKIYFAIKTI